MLETGTNNHNSYHIAGFIKVCLQCVNSCKVVTLLGYNVYRSGTVNSKSFVGKVLLRIKWKFELINAL